LLYTSGDPDYADNECAPLEQLPIPVSAVTLDGLVDGDFPPTDRSSAAANFARPRVQHQVVGAGQDLPHEKPRVFVDAVLDVAVRERGTEATKIIERRRS